MSKVSRQVVLVSRPEGAPKESDFDIIEAPLKELEKDELLLKTLSFSLDPYMRGRMNQTQSYVAPFELGKSMEGAAVCEVLESKSAKFKAGDVVLSGTGWQTHAVVKDKGMSSILDVEALYKIDTAVKPSLYMGALGMPGSTAYHGLIKIGEPKKGETVVVASATGPVGSMVGQLAKIRGCRAVGIAGGPKKCKFAVEELGFDACIDHRSKDMASELKKACPKGIDIYYENVGGPVLSAVIPLLNEFARVPVCGAIHWYNDAGTLQEPGLSPAQIMSKAKAFSHMLLHLDQLPVLMLSMIGKRLKFQGFIISDHFDEYDEFLAEVVPLIQSGKVIAKEDVVKGIENAPKAFMGLLEGKNFGKLVIEI